MLSTFLNYQLYTRDMTRTLDRIASDPVAKREAEYYRENIGKVSSVDEFMGDYRLYSYAMKAYGLGDQIDSRALIKKVLQSDLSDPKSLANRLADEAYRDLANAFTFAATKSEPVAQTTYQTDAIVDAYSEHRVRQAAAVSSNAKTFMDSIGKIEDVDQFLANDLLYSMSLDAVGIEKKFASKSFIREVLTGQAPILAEEEADGIGPHLLLRKMFTFEADGTAPAGGVMDTLKANNFISVWFKRQDLDSSPAAASYDVKYYEEKLPSLANVSDLLGDQRLFKVVMTSVGLDPSIEAASFAANILISDPDDPDNPLAQLPEETAEQKARKLGYTKLRDLFKFDADGNVLPGEPAQTAGEMKELTDAYLKNYAKETEFDDKIATSSFKGSISSVKTANDVIKNEALYNYVLEALDLDPASEDKLKILKVLQSDPSDPRSYARSLRDDRYTRLAGAFNFDDRGRVTTQRAVQTNTNQAETIELYSRAKLTEKATESDREAIAEAANSYRTELAKIVTIDDFLKNKTVIDYAKTAFGLEEEKISLEELRKIVTSDAFDKESYVNTLGDERYVKFSLAFAFDSDGSISRDAGGVQTGADFVTTQGNYLRQLMEEEAGAENEGVRLALNFRRKAPDVSNYYEFLADPAMLKVVQTALGLPAESGQAQIDTQKRMLEKRLDIESLKDPKELEKFINRFLALYDLENGSADANSGTAALSILGSAGGLLGMF
ncbi:MAG: DUF1217 domain-containing protein [Fulvimarina manganoxydans]|uniref:DUF1217 domain-containing protein n=1 Tax=Fulvimarina manganoxydans TaxID=937218 RepID=UPI002353BC3F|nr:DUF1217 domain-containing protein [Fulvimarina manganoxydans]MCK5933569.1 DUF1217 domain-containing protein [Fulvimarina manganoxydans]